MALSWWTGARRDEAEPGAANGPALAPPAGVESEPAELETESIASLAAQWREARALAEAQEGRLGAVEAAAARLYPGAYPDGDTFELIHEVTRDSRGWSRESEAIEASLGLPALEASANCAWKVVDQLSDRLLALRPANAQEAALKYGILMTLLQADLPEDEAQTRLRAFLEDLEHLAAAEPRAH
jgi:hypothetical protein